MMNKTEGLTSAARSEEPMGQENLDRHGLGVYRSEEAGGGAETKTGEETLRPFPKEAEERIMREGWRQAGISPEIGEKTVTLIETGIASARRLQSLLLPRDRNQSTITGEDHERGMRTKDDLFRALDSLGRAIGKFSFGSVDIDYERMKKDAPELQFLMDKVEELKSDADDEITRAESSG